MKSGRHHGHVVTLGVAAAAVALAIPGSASAQPGAGGGGGGFSNNPSVRLWAALDRDFEDFAGKLSLTDAQADSVTGLVADFREENKDVLERVKGMRNPMRAGMRDAGGGREGGERRPERGLQAMREMRGLWRQLAPALETLHEEITGLLDEEQVETLAAMLELRPSRG